MFLLSLKTSQCFSVESLVLCDPARVLSLFLAKESLVEASSILARSGLEPACNKEKIDVKGTPVENLCSSCEQV